MIRVGDKEVLEFYYNVREAGPNDLSYPVRRTGAPSLCRRLVSVVCMAPTNPPAKMPKVSGACRFANKERAAKKPEYLK